MRSIVKVTRIPGLVPCGSDHYCSPSSWSRASLSAETGAWIESLCQRAKKHTRSRLSRRLRSREISRQKNYPWRAAIVRVSVPTIYLVGLNRSGTTALMHAFANNPQFEILKDPGKFTYESEGRL